MMSFKFDLLRARLNEIFGRPDRAWTIMNEAAAPSSLESLREIYALRLKVISSPIDHGEAIMGEAKLGEWAEDPKSSGDKYAALYIEYMRAGIHGERAKRVEIAHDLESIAVGGYYRSALLVTE